MKKEENIEVKKQVVGWLTVVMVVSVLVLLASIAYPQYTEWKANQFISKYDIEEVMVEDGDTLWSLQTEYYPNGHTGKFLFYLEFINDEEVDTANIQSGDVINIFVPKNEKE